MFGRGSARIFYSRADLRALRGIAYGAPVARRAAGIELGMDCGGPEWLAFSLIASDEAARWMGTEGFIAESISDPRKLGTRGLEERLLELAGAPEIPTCDGAVGCPLACATEQDFRLGEIFGG